jgi:hypothetical protein
MPVGFINLKLASSQAFRLRKVVHSGITPTVERGGNWHSGQPRGLLPAGQPPWHATMGPRPHEHCAAAGGASSAPARICLPLASIAAGAPAGSSNNRDASPRRARARRPRAARRTACAIARLRDACAGSHSRGAVPARHGNLTTKRKFILLATASTKTLLESSYSPGRLAQAQCLASWTVECTLVPEQ